MSSEYPGAAWAPSPNYAPGRSCLVDCVVVHITDGGPSLDGAVEHLCQRGGKASAHFVVGRGGEVVQLVHLDDRAWHAGPYNPCSVGIEHCARTPGELDRGGRWQRLTLAQRRLLVAAPELAHSPTDPGLPLTAPQLEASARLVRWLCARFGRPFDPDHVLPHHILPGTSHEDCGLDAEAGGIWPWRQYWTMGL